MTALVWDETSERTYQYGVDHAVLYSYDGPVVWNGILEIGINQNQKSSPVYWDSRKIHDEIELGEVSGKIRALDRPLEFHRHEGVGTLRPGVTLRDQKQATFGLSWRTKVNQEDYKIHLVYNALAVLGDVDFETNSDEIEPVEFEWEFTTTPIELFSHRPASHLAMDSRKVPSDLMALLQEILYGTESSNPQLPALQTVIDLIVNW